jgi:hypothetical protein
MIVRRIVCAIAVLLIAVQVVRNAAVLGLAEASPDVAAQYWSNHPKAEISLAMTEIAEAARDRRAVPNSAFALMRDATVKEPLAPEPFLVRGIRAQLAGDGATAQHAFEAAQWRDPRSLPAAYFLADRYVRTGNTEGGLREIAALARLAPGGATNVAPYLAAYARDRANWPALRTLFRANPALAEPALVTLASSIATVPAALALADPHQKPDKAPWIATLLSTLTDAGKYGEARAIWARVTGVRSDELIHDSSFSDPKAPPPFNWTLTSSAVGLAERQPGARLHVVFYGQEDGMLASQLLLLPPGAYRLSMQVAGDSTRAKALNWSIWCDKASAPIASVTLEGVKRGWQFTVPSGCAAQWLKLSGSSGDIPQEADVTFGTLKLERIGQRA